MKKLLVVLLFVSASAVGCVSNLRNNTCSLLPVSPHKSEFDVEIRGPVTAEDIKKVDQALSVLPKPVVSSVASLTSRTDYKHFDSDIIGHCFWDRRICIIQSLFTDCRVLWHEIGHAYHFYLNQKGFKFHDEWEKIAGKDYADLKRNSKFPQRGILTAYGATNCYEDVAEWVEDAYAYLTGGYSVILIIKQSGELYKDPYLKKLKLLRDYGFISPGNFERILQPF